MTLFFRRFIGALVLDAGVFEEIEADRHAAMQSVAVVILACFGGGVAVMGLGVSGPAGFFAGAVIVLGAWMMWVTAIASLGTITFAEPQTNSNLSELLRTLGFAAAPGVFLAFASMRAAAPFVVALVSLWMIAAAVLGLRQALDYRSTTRAIAVCVLGWLISFGMIALVSAMFTEGHHPMIRILLGVIAVVIGAGVAAAIAGAASWNRATGSAVERICAAPAAIVLSTRHR